MTSFYAWLSRFYYKRKESQNIIIKTLPKFLMDLDENLSRKTDWANLPYPVIHTIAKLDLQNFNVNDRKWLSQGGRLFCRKSGNLCSSAILVDRTGTFALLIWYVNFCEASGEKYFGKWYRNKKHFGFKSSLVQYFVGLFIVQINHSIFYIFGPHK